MSASGDVWLEGSDLVYLDANGVERVYEGDHVRSWSSIDGSPEEELAGSMWVEGDELHYVDEDGEEYALSGDAEGSTTGMEGSIWIEGPDVCFVTESGEKAVLDQGVTRGDPDSDVDVWIEEISAEATTVAAGESVDVTVEWTNYGGAGHEIARTYVGDRLESEDETEEPIEPGETLSTTAPVHTEPEDEGATSITIEFVNSGTVRSVDVTVVESYDSEANVVIEELYTDRDFAVPGDTIVYGGVYTNTGGSGSVVGTLYVGDEEIDTLEFPMDAGESHEGEDEIEITEEHVGAGEVRLEFVGSGSGEATPMEVLDDGPTNVDLLTLDPEQSEVELGEAVEVEIGGLNFADAGRDAARLRLGDRIVYEEAREWGDDESASWTVTVEPTVEDVGAEELTLHFVASSSTTTAELTVPDPCADVDVEGLAVEELSVPDSVQVGRAANVEASFLLCGEEGLYAPDLLVDGEQVWSAFEVIEHYDRLTGTAEVVPGAGEWGELTVRAETGDDEAEQTLTVEPVPFELSVTEPATLEDGVATMTVAVTNEGGATDVQPVELLVDGESVDATELELDAGDTETVELSAEVAPGEQTLTVTTATGEASTPIDVPEPTGDVSVSVGEVRDPVLHSREVLEVPATVVNESDEELTVDVRVRSDVAVATALVDLAGGESREVTQEVEVDPDPDAALELEVRAVAEATGEELATATTTASVVEPLEVTFGENEPAPAGEDGLYRDFTGDGTVGQTDVVQFFQYQHREAVQERAEYFDFSGNGDVSHGDVVALFEDVVVGPY